jgi:hypothetical protein
MEHKLHVRKVLIARDKLRPLNEQEMLKKAAVMHEEKSVAARTGEGVPDLDTVFSQARNGRVIHEMHVQLNRVFLQCSTC